MSPGCTSLSSAGSAATERVTVVPAAVTTVNVPVCGETERTEPVTLWTPSQLTVRAIIAPAWAP